MHALSKRLPQLDDGPWWRQRWPWLLMAGPAIVVVAGSYTTYLALSHPEAMVVGDYYKKGKAINQDLRRDRVATQLGLSLGLSYDPGAGALHGSLHSRTGGAPDAVLILLSHPTLPAHDVRLLARVDGQGRFSVQLPQLERTRWLVTAEDGARSWRLEGNWQWPDQRDVTIAAE